MSIYLGIETSCDETGVAIFKDDILLGERLFSQEKIHAVYGGVVPEIASRNHLEVLPALFKNLILDLDISPKDIDVVSVARGPGLMGSLLVGLSFAKGLCMATNAKLVGVNHLHAHLMICHFEKKIEFPALGLLISGGHTQIYYMKSMLDFEQLGRTLDDAVGEAFDKMAKILNLPYPGGRFINKLAEMGEPDWDMFPLPYVDNDNLDFSFSGLKTAVSNYINGRCDLKIESMMNELSDESLSKLHPDIFKICSSFNHCVAKTLAIKLERAISKTKEIKSIVVAGGVAANTIVRRYMKDIADKYGLLLYMPDKKYCTDNATMIAYTGKILFENGYCHPLDIDAIPRGKPILWDYLEMCNQ